MSKPRERQSTTRARAHGARAARGTARCEKDVRRDVERSVRIAVAQRGRRVGRFLHAIDWTETWLRALLASHAVLLSTVLIYRKSERIQGALFCACTTVVLAAERLNALGSARWESFAGQNYFDERGRFISIVLSTPLLVVTIVILINLLAIMTGMMVEVAKRRRYAGVKKTQ